MEPQKSSSVDETDGAESQNTGEKSLPPSRHGRNIGTPPQTPVQSPKAQRKMADRRYRTQREGRQTVPIADIGLVQSGNRRLRHETQCQQRNGGTDDRKSRAPAEWQRNDAAFRPRRAVPYGGV